MALWLLSWHMSQNPYAQMNQPLDPDPREPQPPATTSVLAIVALILSLTVCLGFLGFILGIIALILISGSGGRKKGKGLALAAVLIGLVTTTVVVGGITLAVRAGFKQMTLVHEPVFDALRKLESGDTSALRVLLAPQVEQNITDAEIIAFRDAYLASNGPCLGRAQDAQAAFAVLSITSNTGLIQRLQTPAGKQPLIFGSSFANGGGGILVISNTVDPTSHFWGSPKLAGTVENIAIASPNTAGIVLTEFLGATHTPSTPVTTPPADPAPANTPPNGNGG